MSLSKLTRIVLGLALILLILQVVVANRLTTAGLTLTNLEKQRQDLNRENELLERKIATFSSLTAVAQKAAEEGFVKAQTVYFVPQFPVAAKDLNGTAR